MTDSTYLNGVLNEKAELDMTSMIDVTFLLMIFFMCTIKFKVLEGKLSAYLPKDVGVNPTPAAPKEKIEVKLVLINEGSKLDPKGLAPYSGTGHFLYAPDRSVQISVNSRVFANVDEVRSRLIELKSLTPENPVEIDARKGVAYGDVVKVLDAVIAANFTEVSFSGSYEK